MTPHESTPLLTLDALQEAQVPARSTWGRLFGLTKQDTAEARARLLQVVLDRADQETVAEAVPSAEASEAHGSPSAESPGASAFLVDGEVLLAPPPIGYASEHGR